MEISKAQMVSILPILRLPAGRGTNMFPAQHIILSQGGPWPTASISPEGSGMRVQIKIQVSKPTQKPEDTKHYGDSG